MTCEPGCNCFRCWWANRQREVCPCCGLPVETCEGETEGETEGE